MVRVEIGTGGDFWGFEMPLKSQMAVSLDSLEGMLWVIEFSKIARSRRTNQRLYDLVSLLWGIQFEDIWDGERKVMREMH